VPSPVEKAEAMTRLRKLLDERHALDVDHPAHALVERDAVQKNLTGSNVGRGTWSPVTLADAEKAYLAAHPFAKSAPEPGLTRDDVRGDAALIMKAAEVLAESEGISVERATLRVLQELSNG